VSIDVGTPSLPSDNIERMDMEFEPKVSPEIVKRPSTIIRYLTRNESVFEGVDSPPDVLRCRVVELEDVDFVVSEDDEVSCSTPL